MRVAASKLGSVRVSIQGSEKLCSFCLEFVIARARSPARQRRPLPNPKRGNKIADHRFVDIGFLTVSATEIIEQFKALPASERARVAKFIVKHDDSWIPESFKQGMADAEAGRLVDLDTALNKPYPGDE